MQQSLKEFNEQYPHSYDESVALINKDYKDLNLRRMKSFHEKLEHEKIP